MATNRRFGRKVPEWARREDAPGTRIDSGPFIGYVKNNFDPIRAGRLQVWIPELGGDEDTPASWRTVSYASPYGGTTYNKNKGLNNAFTQVAHSYGMWGVPPDIDSQVLVTFVAGDPNRGYWFGCVNSDLSHYMMPGNAAGAIDKANLQLSDSDLPDVYKSDSNWPVVEYNEIAPGANNGPGFTNNPKPPHVDQVWTLINQGLDRDTARGAQTSSSQRESPSQVFGISTPGRPTNDPAENPAFLTKMKEGTLELKDVEVTSRKGGHTFIMDDGAQDGTSQLIRLRTAGGHQLLMNDSEDIIYIGNNSGTAWLEFTSGGHISMYSAQGINMRTEGEFNIHADQDINIHSKTNIKMKADSSIAQQTATFTTKATTITQQAGTIGILSTGDIKIQGATGSYKTSGELTFKGSLIYLNTVTPGDVTQVTDIKSYSHRDTTPESGLWESKQNVFDSITTIAPAHEPWLRATATGTSLNQAVIPVTKQSNTSTGGTGSSQGGTGSSQGGTGAAMTTTTPTTPTPATEPSTSGLSVDDLINFTNGSGDRAHYDMLGPDIKTSMEKMAAEYKAKTGRKITLSSAVRTMEEQTKIYNGWLAAGGSSSNRTVNVPGYGRISMPARPSSNSPHVRGVAFDIGRSDIQTLISLGLLDKYAFNFPFPTNDPVHIQYRA